MGLFGRLLGKKSKEEIHAVHFIDTAFEEIRTGKYILPNRPGVSRAIKEKEFDYCALLVALRAADAGAIIKYGIGNPLPIKLLGEMIKECEKISPFVRQNLQHNQKFFEDLEKQGRLFTEVKNVQEANGFWLLYSLKLETIEYTNLENKEGAVIIGNWLFDKYTKYWDNIPNYGE